VADVDHQRRAEAWRDLALARARLLIAYRLRVPGSSARGAAAADAVAKAEQRVRELGEDPFGRTAPPVPR
jgi:hypothetical protein